MSEPQSGRCGSCKAKILWVVMESGKKMPLDFEPDPEGNIVLNADGTGRALTKDLFFQPADGPRYMSHFATCNDPERFRKRR